MRQRKVVDDADSSDYEVPDGEAEEPDEADLSDVEETAAKPGKRAQRTRKPSARKVRRKRRTKDVQSCVSLLRPIVRGIASLVIALWSCQARGPITARWRATAAQGAKGCGCQRL